MFVVFFFVHLKQALTLWPELSLNLWSSCLSLPSAGIIDVSRNCPKFVQVEEITLPLGLGSISFLKNIFYYF